ncbi:MAG: tRNA(Met) cytidine acetyltransferase TmcA domain-containing protein, partial [Pseudomonadota bacterium]
MPANDINRWLRSAFAELQHSQQRQLVVLKGTRAWCDEQLSLLLGAFSQLRLISDRHQADSVIEPRKAASWLGDESDLVVVDVHGGLDPDVICIAAGMVKSGGILLLLSPPVSEWNLEQDASAKWHINLFSNPLKYASGLLFLLWGLCGHFSFATVPKRR